jgi:hypothetical protein
LIRIQTYGTTSEYKAEYKQEKVDQVQEITPFYEYLFDAMQPYDSAYASARMKQINSMEY